VAPQQHELPSLRAIHVAIRAVRRYF
jgi:hypothetical protein